MKGDSAEPSVKTINIPRRNKNITTGRSHHFLLTFKKSQNSFNTNSLFMLIPSP